MSNWSGMRSRFPVVDATAGRDRMSGIVHYAMVLLMGLTVAAGCGQRSDRVVAVAVHPIKPRIVYIVTEEAVYKTRDGGQTWARVSESLSRVRVMNVTIDPQFPANIFAGTFAGGVYKSPDGGRRWLPRNAGLQKGTISTNVNQVVFHPTDTQILYAATTVGVFKSTDGGQSWNERMRDMTEINFIVTLAVDPVRPARLYAGTSGGVYRSGNGANSWTKINHGLVPDDATMASMALGINTLLIDPANPDIVYAGSTRGLFRTLNKGEAWTQMAADLGPLYVSSLVFAHGNSRHLYMGTSRGIFESRDRGLTWVARNDGLDNLNIRAIAGHPENPRVFYVGTNGGGLFRSQDGGEFWTHLPLARKSQEDVVGNAMPRLSPLAPAAPVGPHRGVDGDSSGDGVSSHRGSTSISNTETGIAMCQFSSTAGCNSPIRPMV